MTNTFLLIINMAEEAFFVPEHDSILLKRAIAKILYRKNMEQSKISSLLQLSQPMVSNYCTSTASIPSTISKQAQTIADFIMDGSVPVFHTSVSFTKKHMQGKWYIAKKNEISCDETDTIIDNLAKAFLLLSGKDIGRLLPKVKVNIAMAKKDAKSPEDVASFLNGLVVVDGKVSSFNGVRFGASKHLSSLLLYLQNSLNVHAIMNIAYFPNIPKSRLHSSYLTQDFKLLDDTKHADILFHKGDFGIEPCTYILGTDAIDAAKKFLIFLEEVSYDR